MTDAPDPTAWGQPISNERQAELRALLSAWNAPDAEHGERKGPFDRLNLRGAEVYWLAKQSGRSSGVEVPNLHLEGADLYGAHLEGAWLALAHLEGAYMGAAHLERANLGAAHLERANFFTAHVEHTNLSGAHLEGANLSGAYLEGAVLSRAYLEGADLREAQLVGADLETAYLKGADLKTAHLEGANLSGAHLEGAYLGAAHLTGRKYLPGDTEWQRLREVIPDFPATVHPADLREAVLDGATVLRDAILCAPGEREIARVADVRWNDANLALLDWTPCTEGGALLGDEWGARAWRPEPYTGARKRTRRERAAARREHAEEQRRAGHNAWGAAVRANRQVATALRGQGMNDEADYFSYRAQVCQRRLLNVRGRRGQALFSRFLDLLAGYGFKPERTLATYMVVIAVFTVLYLFTSHGLVGFGMPLTGVKPLLWYQALILSVSAFHGRGFFQELPGDPVALCAALEAIFGLIIEVSFIATFTQRFFGAK